MKAPATAPRAKRKETQAQAHTSGARRCYRRATRERCRTSHAIGNGERNGMANANGERRPCPGRVAYSRQKGLLTSRDWPCSCQPGRRPLITHRQPGPMLSVCVSCDGGGGGCHTVDGLTRDICYMIYYTRYALHRAHASQYTHTCTHFITSPPHI
jgi:hypothetical protein